MQSAIQALLSEVPLQTKLDGILEEFKKTLEKKHHHESTDSCDHKEVILENMVKLLKHKLGIWEAPKGYEHDPPFQRTKITPIGVVPTEDSETSFNYLLACLRLREKYMVRSVQNFPMVTSWFLRFMDGAVDLDDLVTIIHAKHSTNVPSGYSKELPPHVADPWNTDNLKLLPNLDYTVSMVNGVVQVYDSENKLKNYPFPTFKEFLKEFKAIFNMTNDGPLRTFANKRLNVLSSKFDIHVNLNEVTEMNKQSEVPHRDFYNVLKVDTHIHAAACMKPGQLLKAIQKLAEEEPDTPVLPGKHKGDPPFTMKTLFEKNKLDPNQLSVFSLDVHSSRDTMNRFDSFNNKYNPAGDDSLRKVFLKSSNLTKGRYFADLVKQVVKEYEKNKFIYAEFRKSINGESPDDCEEVANWVIENDVFSDNIRWVVQVGRNFESQMKKGHLKSFGESLYNIFGPMIKATIDPQAHPRIAKFLEYVIAFDSVDDEGKPEDPIPDDNIRLPEEWTTAETPPYSYYLYYMHANIAILNQLRRERGLNTFTLRPHCGESGANSASHLLASFLLAENISHGIKLVENPAIQYLYYLAQIPIALSPLSNNALFLPYLEHPLYSYFARGIPVCVSTDDPLMFHFTNEPLLEEYAVAAQVFKLSNVDLCEMARNSVTMSGFPDNVKKFWLGENYKCVGVSGNDLGKSNVPNERVQYRLETLLAELYNLCKGTTLVNVEL